MWDCCRGRSKVEGGWVSWLEPEGPNLTQMCEERTRVRAGNDAAALGLIIYQEAGSELY